MPSLKRKLEDIYTISSGSNKDNIYVIKKEMERVFNLCKKIHVKIYNVRQANCIYLCFGRKHRVLFDVGVPKRPKSTSLDRKEKNVQNSMVAIGRMMPCMVILSHWDIDHIKGVFY